jgi:hypothetical protein
MGNGALKFMRGRQTVWRQERRCRLIDYWLGLLWRVLDTLCYRVLQARLWVVDAECGPKPPTVADEKRKAEHERLLVFLRKSVSPSGAKAVATDEDAQRCTDPIQIGATGERDCQSEQDDPNQQTEG